MLKTVHFFAPFFCLFIYDKYLCFYETKLDLDYMYNNGYFFPGTLVFTDALCRYDGQDASRSV